MAVAEAAAVGVHREVAAGAGLVDHLAVGAGLGFGEEGAALALGHEAEVFGGHQRGEGEGVVEHAVLDVLRAQPGALVGGLAGDAVGVGGGVVAHLRDHPVGVGLARAQHVDGRLGEVARALLRDEHQRAAAVGHDAAVEQVEGVADHPRVEHVFGGDRPAAAVGRAAVRAHHRHRVEVGPGAGRGGDVGEMLLGGAVLVEVAQDGDREGGRCAADGEGRLILRAGRLARAAAPHVDARAPALAVRDQRDIAVAGHDRGDGVAHMDHERAAAHGGAVDVARLDAEVFGDLVGDRAGAEQAVDVGELESGVVERVARRLRVEREAGHAGQVPQVVGFGCAHDGDFVADLIHRSSLLVARRSPSGVGRLWRRSLDQPEFGQGDLVGHVVEDDLDGRVDPVRAVLAQVLAVVGVVDDQVGHQARPLVEFDDGDDIRRGVLHRRDRQVADHVGVHLALAGDLPPVDLPVEAVGLGAEGARVEVEGAAGRAVGQDQLVLLESVPVGLRFGRRLRQRAGVVGHAIVSSFARAAAHAVPEC